MEKIMNIVITGATDGIGLFTAQKLAQHYSKLKIKLNLGIHGRSEQRIQLAVNKIKECSDPSLINVFTFKSDLAQINQTLCLVKQIEHEMPNLNILINNAAVFNPDYQIIKQTKDNEYVNIDLENTFAVNVASLYILSKLANQKTRFKELTKIVNTSSISHWYSCSELQKLDLENLQSEKGYDMYDSYGRSKLCVLMLTSHLINCNVNPDLVYVTMDPGTVNTKMLLAGWGRCGIEVDEATSTFNIAVGQQYGKQSQLTYYVNCQQTQPAKIVDDHQQSAQLCHHLDGLIKQVSGQTLDKFV